ncbi:MAG: hypothetical protein J6Q35_07670 [Rikenellaceae bacterium]|nr:hypothetical protein [Rikenellaceae bacterium]
MKFKTTQKAIRNGYKRVFAVGAADLQYLLTFENPMAYNSGVYGWNCDIYDFGDIALTTGYRPFGESLPYELVREFNTQAKDILTDSKLEYTECKELVYRLLWEVFLNAIDK